MPFGFDAPTLSDDVRASLSEQRRHAAADIVRLTTLAGCGHPGGSLSTLDALLVLYACMQHDPAEPHRADRDRVIVSHGHISPGVYSTLGAHGYFDMRDAYIGFRRAGSVFGGHVESVVPGVEWNTGNLGQGLSAGCGLALGARVRGHDWHTFVLMGDGEQQKGQISEARRFAAKYRLTGLTALVDVNGLQIGGATDDIMPMNLGAMWAADGWRVVEVDGHDHDALYAALRDAVRGDHDAPTVLLMRTVMGRGLPFIENDHRYHGQALTADMVEETFRVLELDNDIAELKALRAANREELPHRIPVDRAVEIAPGVPATYGVDVTTDCRSAYGHALDDLARVNATHPGAWPIVGFSCDLEGSVKMNAFHKRVPERFFEVGISEHHAAVLAGAISHTRVVPFYSTFGMFAVDEGYNQQRLNDQNHTNIKVVMTHCGLDVGEDGPTHQCIDYVALLRNLFGWQVFVPADPNECDRIVRHVATQYGPTCVAMGRSKLATIATLDGEPALGGDHRFEPGVWPVLRDGDDAVVFAVGPMVSRAVTVSDELRAEGFGLRVVNASSLQPFDRDAILKAGREVGRVLTYEDHNVHTGLGAIVAGVYGDEGVAVKLRRLGVSRYGTSGVPDDLFAEQGLAPSDLKAAALALR